MNSTPNPEQTNPYDVAVAALRQARQHIEGADRQLPRVNEQASKLAPNSARHRSALQNRLAVPPHRSSLGKLALKGLIGLLVAACIGTAAMVLLSHGDAAQQVTARWEPQPYLISSPKAAPPQPTLAAQTLLADSASTAAGPSPGQEQLLQSMARGFLAAVEQEIEQLKARIEQLKTSQEQMAEQLKASQEQMVRDNAAIAAQLKAIQEQMSRLLSKDFEQQLRPKTSAAAPRPIATPSGKPLPKFSSPQARAQPLAPVQRRPE